MGALVLCAPVASRAINAVAPAAGGVQQGAPVAWPSPGIADIVKLVDTKVDATVIQTYVRNAPTAYNPSATEIIALKGRGVGPEILTAMLQRGAELRAQSMRAAPQHNPGAAARYASAPAYSYSPQPVCPDYPYSYPVSSYAYPSYAYGYPDYNYGYNYYGCSWPYYGPSLGFSFGCYPYGGYGGYRYPYWGGGYGHGHYGGTGYRGGAGYYGGTVAHGQGGRSASFTGISASFHSGSGFSGRSAPFASHGGGFGGHSGGRGR